MILYPDIGEPYRSIFAKIIEGIEQQLKTPIHSYAIVNNQSPGDLPAQLKRNGTKVVIALGRQGLKVASAMENDFAVVAGGVLSIPESEASNLTGISLTPDPALLFLRLKNLIPTVKRIIVIYNPQNNDWLLKLAHDAAKTQGLEIVAYEARDLAASARLYETAFSGSDSRRDAVWLPQDATTVDEATILPLVLKESWNRGIPIFSSSSLHVKRGALFSLSLNPIELGRSLAGVAQTALSGDAHKHGMRPLREVYSAINVRTASHIGLNIDYQKQRSFDFVYPEP